MIESAIKTARDHSTAQVLVFIISRNMIKRIAGIHSCTAKTLTQRPSDVVQGVLSTDPNMKPSTIQSLVNLKPL